MRPTPGKRRDQTTAEIFGSYDEKDQLEILNPQGDAFLMHFILEFWLWSLAFTISLCCESRIVAFIDFFHSHPSQDRAKQSNDFYVGFPSFSQEGVIYVLCVYWTFRE